VVSKDDGPRPGTNYEAVSQLKPVFRPDGSVTAGNACPLNDGAAAVMVMSDTKAKQLGLTPLARIVSSGVSGLNPEIMGLGPIEAIRKALALAGKTIDEIDLVEINEAFAVQVIGSAKHLGIPMDKIELVWGDTTHPWTDHFKDDYPEQSWAAIDDLNEWIKAACKPPASIGKWQVPHE
jgi:acetyl-CoA C-acetyltransferase